MAFSKHKGMEKKESKIMLSSKAVALIPLAIPMLAGASSISLLIGLNEKYDLLTQNHCRLGYGCSYCYFFHA